MDIKIVRGWIYQHSEGYIEEQMKDIIVEALDKRVPEKPIIKTFNDIMRMMEVQKVCCPNCGDYLVMVELEKEKKDIFKKHE